MYKWACLSFRLFMVEYNGYINAIIRPWGVGTRLKHLSTTQPDNIIEEWRKIDFELLCWKKLVVFLKTYVEWMTCR